MKTNLLTFKKIKNLKKKYNKWYALHLTSNKSVDFNLKFPKIKLTLANFLFQRIFSPPLPPSTTLKKKNEWLSKFHVLMVIYKVMSHETLFYLFWSLFFDFHLNLFFFFIKVSSFGFYSIFLKNR